MEPVRDGLNRIVRDALRAAPRDQMAVWAWPLVCGPTVAARTEALSCAGNRLRVLAPDAAWRSQLQSFIPQYLAALENFTGLKLAGIDFEPAGRRHPQPAGKPGVTAHEGH